MSAGSAGRISQAAAIGRSGEVAGDRGVGLAGLGEDLGRPRMDVGRGRAPVVDEDRVDPGRVAAEDVGVGVSHEDGLGRRDPLDPHRPEKTRRVRLVGGEVVAADRGAEEVLVSPWTSRIRSAHQRSLPVQIPSLTPRPWSEASSLPAPGKGFNCASLPCS